MRAETLRQALTEQRSILGTLLVNPSPHLLPVISELELDFIFIDTEHIAIDHHQLSWMCQAYHAAGLAAVVRIPSPCPFAASKAIDDGAAAVLAPYIETPQQVQALVGAVKHKPVKGQLLEQMLADPQSLPAQRTYAERCSAQRSLIVNIESTPALAALDEILAVPGLDGIIIGPHDLSVSLGLAEQWFHPRFEETVCTILRKARALNKSAGIHIIYDNAHEQYQRFIDAGANIIIHLADILAVRIHLHNEFNKLRVLCNKSQTMTASSLSI